MYVSATSATASFCSTWTRRSFVEHHRIITVGKRSFNFGRMTRHCCPFDEKTSDETAVHAIYSYPCQTPRQIQAYAFLLRRHFGNRRTKKSVYYLFVIKLKSSHNDHSSTAGSVAVPMPNRTKIYLGLAISAGVCTGIGLILFYRHRRQITRNRCFTLLVWNISFMFLLFLSVRKTTRPLSPGSFLRSSRLSSDQQQLERNSSSDIDYDDSESISFPSRVVHTNKNTTVNDFRSQMRYPSQMVVFH